MVRIHVGQPLKSLEIHFSSNRRRHLALLLAVIGVLAGIALVAWKTNANKDVALLIHHSSAEWILYPKPPDGGGLYRNTEINTVYRRQFSLAQLPANAIASLRAMKRWQMSVNGSEVKYIPPPGDNWKNATSLDLTSKLQTGTNQIEITVFNTNGPPALWLNLTVLGMNLDSGTNWECSLWEADWKQAGIAGERLEFPLGSAMLSGESPISSFIKCLPSLLLFAFFSFAIFFGGRFFFRTQQKKNAKWESNFSWMVLGLIAFLWVALYVHNLGLLPYQMGFDTYDHLRYINFIRTQWKLPLANEGWQMYQPPLYHIISAVLLTLFNTSTDASTAMVLRALGCVIGMANFTFIFLSLRLLFPGRLGPPLFGLVLAAFVGENLYISQFISNESLCGMLASGSLYFCLRILKAENPSGKLHIILGLFLGAALLAKFTALLLYPFVGAALAARLIVARNYNPGVWMRTIGMTLIAAFAVCGWHYFRVWKTFGTPMVGNWDVKSGYQWWLEDGYQTPAYFFCFGRCLQYPWFSGFNGFLDGLYSTQWGDGLWSGMTSFPDRAPWNFDLMASGYLLAIVPTCLILAGAILAIKKFARHWHLSWIMLLGIVGAMFAALALMCLKVPTYGSAKAFYGLVALLPLCALAALAWEAISRRRFFTPVLAGLIGLWAMTSFASYWIRGTAETHILLGRLLMFDGHKEDARREYALALKLAPKSGRAECLVGGLLPDPAESLALLKTAIDMDPNNAESHSQLALAFAQNGQYPEAVVEDQKALLIAPNYTIYHLFLSQHLFTSKQFDAAITAARRGLDCSPLNFKLHYGMGLAYMAEGKTAEAVIHLSHAAAIDPTWFEADDQLGQSLTALGRTTDAIVHLSRAALLQPTNSEVHHHLAIAYSAAGDIPAAISQYRQILQLNPDSLVALNNLAWILAANADPRWRDGAEAVRLSRRACDLTQEKVTHFLGTLAAAYAEAGQFDEAVATANQAIKQAKAEGANELARTNQKLLELYQEKHAFHETAPVPLPSAK